MNYNFELSEQEFKVIELILNELKRAETKHPDWPTNHLYQAAIVQEETGELIREGVKLCMMESDADENKFIKEAIHTAAMAFRLIKNNI